MAWCRQAPSHYLNQCWPSSLTPYASLGHNELRVWMAVVLQLILLNSEQPENNCLVICYFVIPLVGWLLLCYESISAIARCIWYHLWYSTSSFSVIWHKSVDLEANIRMHYFYITWPSWHDEVMTWKCFPHYWPFVRGIHHKAPSHYLNQCWPSSLTSLHHKAIMS